MFVLRAHDFVFKNHNTLDFGKLEGASSLIVLTETMIMTSLLLKLFGALKQIVITASPSTIFETIANEY